jgi:mannitol/fructose-specific phosphotransferase system IIA component (Ntr-type)
MIPGATTTAFDTSLFIPELRFLKLEPVLGEMCARAARAGHALAPRLLRGSIALRDRAGSTGIGKGAAVPHARSIHVLEPFVVFARSRRGVVWDAPDGERVRLVLMMLSPPEVTADAHVDWVARGAGLLRLQRHRQRLLEADSFDAVAALLMEVVA